MPGQAVHLCGGDVIVCGASSLVCCVVSPTASGTRTADAAAELNARAARANGRLLVVAHESIRCWPVTKASTVLGRSPACDIHLPYQGVAPSHARIIHTDCGFLLQNTTFHFTLLLNGRTVTAAPLQTNSAIVLGSVQLLFAYDLEPDGTRVRAAIDRLPRRTVCRYLMRHAHVPSDQLARLMKERVKSNAQLGEVAVRRGYITPASWRAICDSALRERTNYTRALDRIRRLFWRFRP